MTPLLALHDVGKSFTMHLRGGLVIPVVERVSFAVEAGECVVLGGPSGAGKSSILKMIFGNYRVDRGAVRVRHDGEALDIARLEPRRVIEVRRRTLGYVSQFLRVVPRVPALDIVAGAGLAFGLGPDEAHGRAGALLRRLNLPERLWGLPPSTFSGGEQQRINIARGFIADHPILLLDEPTASLDARNRAAVVELIAAKRRRGVAVLGVFHDEDVREAVATRLVDVSRFSASAA